jgi:hypothetical protein
MAREKVGENAENGDGKLGGSPRRQGGAELNRGAEARREWRIRQQRNPTKFGELQTGKRKEEDTDTGHRQKKKTTTKTTTYVEKGGRQNTYVRTGIRTYAWKYVCVSAYIRPHGRTYGCISTWMDGRTDGWMDGVRTCAPYAHVADRMCGCMDVRIRVCEGRTVRCVCGGRTL